MNRFILSLAFLAAGFSLPSQPLFADSEQLLPRKSWSKFRKSFGKEKIKVKFPQEPEMGTEGGIIVYSSQVGSGPTYILVGVPVSEHDEFREDSSEFFLSFLSTFNDRPFEIISFDLYKKGGLGYLDTVIRWKDTDELLRGRIVATKYNLFLLGTQHRLTDKHEHDYFIDSFEISH